MIFFSLNLFKVNKKLQLKRIEKNIKYHKILI